MIWNQMVRMDGYVSLLRYHQSPRRFHAVWIVSLSEKCGQSLFLLVISFHIFCENFRLFHLCTRTRQHWACHVLMPLQVLIYVACIRARWRGVRRSQSRLRIWCFCDPTNSKK